MEVREGIHRIEAPLGDRYVALYLVVGDDCSLLVDSGLDESVRVQLRDYLMRTGLAPTGIRYLVNTHADFDHIGGNGAVRELSPEVLIACGAPDREMIEDVEVLIDRRYGEFRRAHGFDETDETKEFIRSSCRLLPVDLTLTGGETFNLGGRRVEVIPTPGHSRGHLALYDEATDSAIIADAALATSVLTASGEPAFPPTYRYVEAYRATARALLALDADVLLTSHYPVAVGPSAADFLHRTLTYCDTVERVVSDVLSAADHPLTLLEVCRAGAGRLGPWPAGPADYLIYPVLGHIESIEERGFIGRSAGSDGLTRWRPLPAPLSAA